MDPILKRLTARQREMLALLRKLVEMESPSTDKSAVDRLGRFLAEELSALGGRISIHKSRATGDHIRAEFFGERSPAPKQLLLLGHMDTVWDTGTLARMPFRLQRGCACGPGIFDMKSGMVLALYALRSLQEMNVPVRRRVALLLNADEEIGSPSSRPLTEAEAARSAAALVLEPSHGPKGALKTSRKGTGEYRICVEGRAAHAGLEPEKGSSAIIELSRQLITLESFADKTKGTTLNAGVIRGGTRANVVAAQAEALVDLRVCSLAEQARVDRALRALKPQDRRARLHVTGGMNRPPFERSLAGTELFERARLLARPLGIALRQASVGGGSDGNFTAALGVPTLDGLGAVGGGAHAADEHIIIAELPRRAALLAHLIASLAA